MPTDTEAKIKRSYPNSPFVVVRPNYRDKDIIHISYAEAIKAAPPMMAVQERRPCRARQ